MGRKPKPKPEPKGWTCPLCLPVIVKLFTKRQEHRHNKEKHDAKPGWRNNDRVTRRGKLSPFGHKPRVWPEGDSPEEAKKRRKPNE